MTRHPSPVALKLTPSPVPETETAVQITLANPREPESNELLLHPGRQGEIAATNVGDRPLSFLLEVKGNVPPEWYAGPLEQPIWLETGETCERAIVLEAPADFFERSLEPGFAIEPEGDRARLPIDYVAEVLIYTHPQAADNAAPQPPSQPPSQPPPQPRQLVGYQVFQIRLRPPSPYLSFLPALYREVDFVGRFLAIIEQAFDPVVQTMDEVWAYLDPLTAPEALLPFLAHWIGWTIDPRWDTQQQRRLIRNAVTLYRWHGTRRGLRFYLHLYTGLPLDEEGVAESEKHIAIEEVFSCGFALGSTTLGQDSMLGGGRPYHFNVTLRCDRPEQAAQLDESAIRAIIEQQKPAFGTYDLSIS
ncbi:MAG: phage tail protein [Cyanobacteria bacterium J069]|nr:MAG: phage tail protein [Cyanobacteria bacterium J069]